MLPRELLPLDAEKSRGAGAVLFLIAADVFGAIGLGVMVWIIFSL